MFSTNHFIWLFFSFLVIGLFVYFTVKKKIKLETILPYMIFIGFLFQSSVILFQIYAGQSYDGNLGYFLDLGAFPLHLCSIQVFFMVYLKLNKRENKTRQIILNFMYSTCLLGALMALLIPTEGVDFYSNSGFLASTRYYEYFLYHGLLVGFAIYLYIMKYVKLNFKSFYTTFLLILIAAYFSLFINGALKTNYLFTAYPPMNNLPILNLDNGWDTYIISLLIVSVFCLIVTYIPTIIKYFKNKKTKKDNNIYKNIVS